MAMCVKGVSRSHPAAAAHLTNLFIIFILIFLTLSCKGKNSDAAVIKQETLFTLSYGNFADEINLFSMRDIGDICTGLAMQDGFFFIVNGEAQKIMKTTSYGDLLTVFYNKDYYEKIGNTLPLLDEPKELWQSIDMPFRYTGKIATDRGLRFFVVASAPADKTIHLDDDNLQLQQVILVINGDTSAKMNPSLEMGSKGAAAPKSLLAAQNKSGSLPRETGARDTPPNVDAFYIGAEGEGGNPFPFIKNISVTENGELVVICVTNDGLEVFWYTKDYKRRHKTLLRRQDIPNTSGAIVMLDNVAADPYDDTLFVKVDYYMPHYEVDSNLQSGIDYTETLIYPYNVEKRVFGEPVPIPPFTQNVYSKATGNSIYKLPYEFLGVTKNGTFFFMTATIDGFNVEAVKGGRVAKRNFLIDHDDVIYYTFNLASSGIISGLLARKDEIQVSWWRCDALLGD